jgi:hypothetical protein
MQHHSLAYWTLVTLIVVALASAAWAANAINVRVPLSNTSLNPCNGELVDLSGSCHVVVSVTFDRSGGTHFDTHEYCHATGVGRTTGAEYVANESEHNTLNENSGGSITVTNPISFRLISNGREPNFIVYSLFHVTVNPDGTATSFFSNFFEDCPLP